MKAPQHPEMVSISKKIEEPVEVVHHAEKQDIPPAIIDPGNFDLGWILAPGDRIEELENCPYLTQEEIKIAIQNKKNVDQLYLVKWRGLSYN
jgi:hypothetical protein